MKSWMQLLSLQGLHQAKNNISNGSTIVRLVCLVDKVRCFSLSIWLQQRRKPLDQFMGWESTLVNLCRKRSNKNNAVLFVCDGSCCLFVITAGIILTGRQASKGCAVLFHYRCYSSFFIVVVLFIVESSFRKRMTGGGLVIGSFVCSHCTPCSSCWCFIWQKH